MSNHPTKFTEQEVLSYSTDDTVAPPLLQVGLRTWNGSSWVRNGLVNSIGDGSKAVTTAGTRVQLASDTSCKWVKIIALEANTGTIWVGGSTVASGRGEPLVAQQSTDKIEVNNLNQVYIDSTVNAEGVSFIYGS